MRKKILSIIMACLMAASVILLAPITANAGRQQDMVLEREEIHLVEGQVYTIACILLPYGSQDDIIWESEDEKIVWINQDGVAHALKPGSVTITAYSSDKNMKATTEVKVRSSYVPVTGVTLNTSTIGLDINQYFIPEVDISPYDASNKKVNWSSSNPAVATVDANGKITGVSAGVSLIACITEDKGFYSYITVTVNNNIITPSEKKLTLKSHMDANINSTAVQTILTAAPNAVVNVGYPTSMAYDKNVASALASRPDVTLQTTFYIDKVPYVLIIPAGYNLLSHLDETGYVEWLTLCNMSDGPYAMIITQ